MNLDYPVCLRLQDRPVTVVGAGVVATGRIEQLLLAGAKLHVIAPEASAFVRDAAGRGELRWSQRRAAVFDVATPGIVFIAITEDPSDLVRAARAAGAILNVADVPEHCDFTLPSVGRDGPITVAVSTSGQGPAVARRLRQDFTATVSRHHHHLLRLVQFLRRRAPAGPTRMAFIRDVVDGEVGERLLAGDRRGAFQSLRRRLAPSRQDTPAHSLRPGSVTLVGAGPGAADLLTLRALKALKAADVVVTDRLVGDDILALIPPTARVIYAGKKGGGVSVPQDQTNALLIDAARAGHRVVRLKGGDPFVFGRGGEEALALAAAGIDVDVVPGLTAGVAAAALADIPVTHRGRSRSVLFATAVSDRGLVDAKMLAAADTLVLYMAGQQLPQLTHDLILAGRAADTPAAVVEAGSLPGQRVIVGTLATIAALAADAAVGSPALTVVGDVVLVREELARLRAEALASRHGAHTPAAAEHFLATTVDDLRTPHNTATAG